LDRNTSFYPPAFDLFTVITVEGDSRNNKCATKAPQNKRNTQRRYNQEEKSQEKTQPEQQEFPIPQSGCQRQRRIELNAVE